jgi:hypothetical protein
LATIFLARMMHFSTKKNPRQRTHLHNPEQNQLIHQMGQKVKEHVSSFAMGWPPLASHHVSCFGNRSQL